MAMYRKPSTTEQRQQWALQMLQKASASAVVTFDTLNSQVQRVEMKINPQVVGEFLFLAILTNDERYEGRIKQGERQFTWCKRPQCTCMGFASTMSPMHFGATIDD